MPTPDGATPAAGAEHAAVIDFEYADAGRARVVADSVGVEVGEIADDRSRADVTRDGRVVRVGVEAADLVALRAGLNTWLRLVDVAEGVAGDAFGRSRTDGGDGPPDGGGTGRSERS